MKNLVIVLLLVLLTACATELPPDPQIPGSQSPVGQAKDAFQSITLQEYMKNNFAKPLSNERGFKTETGYQETDVTLNVKIDNHEYIWKEVQLITPDPTGEYEWVYKTVELEGQQLVSEKWFTDTASFQLKFDANDIFDNANHLLAWTCDCKEKAGKLCDTWDCNDFKWQPVEFFVDLSDTPGNQCQSENKKCIADTARQICNNGQWSKPEPCHPGEICENGECTERAEVQCVSSNNCQSGQLCVEGSCVGNNNPKDCRTEGCPGNQKCSLDSSGLIAEWNCAEQAACAKGQTLVDGACTSVTKSDCQTTGCPANELCLLNSEGLIAKYACSPCQKNQEIVNGKCESIIKETVLSALGINTANGVIGEPKATTVLATSSIGMIGESATFDGESQFILYNHQPDFDVSTMSIEAWFSTDNPNKAQVIINHDKEGYILQFDGTNLCAKFTTLVDLITHKNIVPVQACTPSNIIKPMQWYHVVSTFNKEKGLLHLYLNGQLMKEQGFDLRTEKIHYSSDSALCIGAPLANSVDCLKNRLFKGSLDEVKLYSKALTPLEVKQKYESAPTQPSVCLRDSDCETKCVAGICSLEDPTPIYSYNFDTPTDSALETGVTLTSGVLGKAGKFSGSSTVVQTANSPKPQKISVEAWIKPSTISESQKIVSITEGGGYQLSFNSGGDCGQNTLCFLVNFAGKYVGTTVASSSIAVNSWQHIVGTYDGTSLKLYKDGVQVSSTPASGSIKYHPTTPLCMGMEAGPPTGTFKGCSNFAYKGEMDEIRVYDFALSDSHVKQRYDETKPKI